MVRDRSEQTVPASSKLLYPSQHKRWKKGETYSRGIAKVNTHLNIKKGFSAKKKKRFTIESSLLFIDAMLLSSPLLSIYCPSVAVALNMFLVSID